MTPPAAAPGLTEPQRWALSQDSVRVSSGRDPRDRATAGMAREWRAALDELVTFGLMRKSRSGRYRVTDAGRAAAESA